LGDSYTYAEQKEQLGTGHAVKCAKDFIGDSGDVLILCGDTQLIDGDTLKKLCDEHTKGNHTATLLSTIVDDPTGYGRIIRDAAGSFVKNVEHKDASEEELKSKEINGGMYLFDAAALSSALDNLSNDNAQGEYYLPDTLEIIKNAGGKVEAYVAEDPTVILGVNDKEQLKTAADLLEARS
jgi:bifunctional UDP-N-acetylglucosamine pyrophosphorylase/glucosamine-1-phosphate N-acetyltransferase